jgi:hypothetical protein
VTKIGISKHTRPVRILSGRGIRMQDRAMRLTTLEIDALEDVRVMIQIRCLGPSGVELAKLYSNRLMNRAMEAFGKGDYQEALHLAEREFKFDSQNFGLQHCYTKTARQSVVALRKQINAATPTYQPTVSFVMYSLASA